MGFWAEIGTPSCGGRKFEKNSKFGYFGAVEMPIFGPAYFGQTREIPIFAIFTRAVVSAPGPVPAHLCAMDSSWWQRCRGGFSARLESPRLRSGMGKFAILGF